MAYLTLSRDGKRFLGHRDKKEVHDLKNEKTGPNGCGIHDIIRADQAVGFISDTLDEARKAKYTPCVKCIGPANPS